MPPLTTSRFKRLVRGLFAATVVLVGAMGGPVAPAGAGAPAGHTVAVESLSGPLVSRPSSGTTLTPLVTDLLGTHSSAALTPSTTSATRLGACDANLYGSAFTTRLGST